MKSIIKIVLPIVVVIALSCQTILAGENHMREALDALSQARSHLKAAQADKGGHRVKAIRSIDEAIAHVKEGIKFDREHETKKEEKRKEKEKD